MRRSGHTRNATPPRRAGTGEAYPIASRWAVKEAVFKCLGATWTPDASFADIVVTRSASGAPEVAVRGDFAAVLAARGGGALLVSLSVSGDTAVAVAAVE